jgi:Fur family transcriptional regulator, ferric uptake regulator
LELMEEGMRPVNVSHTPGATKAKRAPRAPARTSRVAPPSRADRRDAEAAIRATGARLTQGRVKVLEVLQRAGRALTHNEIEREVTETSPLDRVTVYRVLDWLTREQIAHKVPGDDRVWRFTIAGQKQAHQHAHFQCTDCSQVICLEEDVAASIKPRLPTGYRSVGVEVTVKGQCRDCGLPRRRRG